MKVAMTGHAEGVGLAIADAFRARGAEVVALPDSDGEPAAQRDHIVAALADCDVFVNSRHPHDDDTQLQLLFQVAGAWQRQDKTIINLASRAGDRPVGDAPDPYAVYMRALDAACQQLFNRADQRPRVVNIRLDGLDAASVTDGQAHRLSPQDVAKVVMWVIDQPRHVYVSSITVAHRLTQSR